VKLPDDNPEVVAMDLSLLYDPNNLAHFVALLLNSRPYELTDAPAANISGALSFA